MTPETKYRIEVSKPTYAAIVAALTWAATAGEGKQFGRALNEVKSLRGVTKTGSKRLNRIRAVAARDGYRCWYCGAQFTEESYVTIDHEMPKSAGGTDALPNLRLCCRPCNEAKGGIHGTGSFKAGTPSRPSAPLRLYSEDSA